VHVQFAEEYGAGGLEAADNFGVLGRDAIGEDSTGASGTDARGVHEVFQRDWDAVKRATPTAPAQLGFQFASLGERGFGGDGDEGVEERIEALDSCQAGLSQFDRRNGFLSDAGGGFGESKLGEIIIGATEKSATEVAPAR
jgi:hypothetical protein